VIVPAGPVSPIAAVTHPDPYPYYREMVATRPLHRDQALRLWVAAGADAVTAVLTSPLARVRPAAEPVPAALRGSPLAEIFGRLVRMTDGPGHDPMKEAVAGALATLDPDGIRAGASRWARTLAERRDARRPAGVDEFARSLSAHAIASLLAVPDAAVGPVERSVHRYVSAVAPGADAPALEHGRAAAVHLTETVGAAVAGAHTGLPAALGREAERAGAADRAALVANAIGFMTQAYEATAGLIGNTLRALAAQPALRASVAADPAQLEPVMREVLRHDAPVQNTRRFVAEDGVIAGQPMAAGDTVLVVLAAANHDAAANPRPERFDVGRADRRTFTFGAGPHACPGETLAVSIARAGVEALLAHGLDLDTLPARPAYQPSGNVRIPLFAGASARG
jgi:cytochrome P450